MFNYKAEKTKYHSLLKEVPSKDSCLYWNDLSNFFSQSGSYEKEDTRTGNRICEVLFTLDSND